MKIIRQLGGFLTADVTINTRVLNMFLCMLFFLSGSSALIYQFVWQRLLFTLLGVDMVSITIIVSIFMFGLGMGGLIGGVLADMLPRHRLTLYTVIELGIAIFGFYSITIINWFVHGVHSDSAFLTATLSFFILSIPTMLMGATFPILVTYVHEYDKNIGRSVGGLYFANSLGGAVGAYFSGFVLLYAMDLTGLVNCAAFLNFLIAMSTYLIFRKQ